MTALTEPSLDPQTPVENAVVARLQANWARRAMVKKPEPQWSGLFDQAKHDYPDELIPFSSHPVYRDLPEDRKQRLRALAWIAFNKNVIDVEQYVVNPGLALLARDAFDTGLGDTLALAVSQAMVDEQYHSLMHLQANATTRRERAIALRESELPPPTTVRAVRSALDTAESERDADLITLAYTTVAEISITSYLSLIEDGPDIQPLNRAVVALHERDEYCHASITEEVAAVVYRSLNETDRASFQRYLDDAMAAFSANDMTTWRFLLGLENIEGHEQMLADVAADTTREPLLQDYSGIERLRRALPH